MELTKSGKCRTNGVTLWSGPSRINSQPIAVVATGLKNFSQNSKTGGVIQTYIFPVGLKPTEAVKVGLDVANCGGCIHRGNKTNKRTCYVNLGQGPNSVYKAYQKGSYPLVDWSLWDLVARDRIGRLGTWGDPGSTPLDIWNNFTRPLSGWLGYTHQSGNRKLRDVLKYCQVSCDSLEDAQNARQADLGSFRVIGKDSPPLQSWETACPASTESGKILTCEQCLKCDGISGNHIAIQAHGSTGLHVQESNRRPLQLTQLTS